MRSYVKRAKSILRMRGAVMAVDIASAARVATERTTAAVRPTARIASIDWMRGLVMILMIVRRSSRRGHRHSEPADQYAAEIRAQLAAAGPPVGAVV